MRLCMNNMTVHEVMCEQQCYACETNESSKGKWKGVMEQRKKIVTLPPSIIQGFQTWCCGGPLWC